MNTFVKLTREATVGNRTYPPRAIVEVDSTLSEILIRSGAGEANPGPAIDPSAPRRSARETADA